MYANGFQIRTSLRLAILFFAFICFPVLAQEESIALDPATGNYIIIYQGLDLEANRTWQRVVYIPPTKIKPIIKSRFKMISNGTISYRYKIKNGQSSQQKISHLIVQVSNIDQNRIAGPKDWPGIAVSTFKNGDLRLSWGYEGDENLGGLSAGSSLEGFIIESNDIPGVSIVEVRGAVESLGFPDEGPGNDNPIYPQFRKVLANDFISRFAAVPRISVPNPFDAAVVLTNLQKHVDQDLLSMKLIDSALVAQLDRLFLAAVDAARRNNIAGLRSNLKDIRQALKKEHEDVDKDEDNDKDTDQKAESGSIDKLAAKVLDFDVKYILKRIGDGESEKRTPPPPPLGPPR